MPRDPEPGQLWLTDLFSHDRYVHKDQRQAKVYQEFVDMTCEAMGVPSLPLWKMVVQLTGTDRRRKDYYIRDFVEASVHMHTRIDPPVYVIFEPRPFHTVDDILWALVHECAHIAHIYANGNTVRYIADIHGKGFTKYLFEALKATGLIDTPNIASRLAFEVVYSDAPKEVVRLAYEELGIDLDFIRQNKSKFKPDGRFDIQMLSAAATRGRMFEAEVTEE